MGCVDKFDSPDKISSPLSLRNFVPTNFPLSRQTTSHTHVHLVPSEIKMLKNTVLRQARLCRAVPNAYRSIVTATRSTFRPAKLSHPQSWNSGARSLAGPSISHFAGSRNYSAGAAEQRVESSSQAASPGAVTRFADLASLGVHPNLVSAITEGMQYDDMTEVQALTINPALSGQGYVRCIHFLDFVRPRLG